MQQILADLAEHSKLESPPSQQGKKMIAMLAPK
jgi:translation initiation factor IF-3